jgi:AraC-like DNA-binding protein
MAVERTFLTVPGVDHSASSPIRLLICSKHRVLRAGLRLLVETDARINVVAETDVVSAIVALAQIERADIILLDEDLADTVPDTMWIALQLSLPTARVLLLHDAGMQGSPHSLRRRQGLGTVSKGDAPEALVEAIRRVHAGDALHPEPSRAAARTPAPLRPVRVAVEDGKHWLLKLGAPIPPKPISDKRVVAVLETVENDLQTSHSIETLARSVGIGDSRLRHLLRDLVGMSLSKFRKERRLQVAAHLLADTHKRVSEIAYQVGFSDLAYFDKAFRKRYGQSPTRYRQSNSPPQSSGRPKQESEPSA